MSTATLPAVLNGPTLPASAQLARGIEPVVAAVEGLKAIRTFVAAELKPNVDFGLIPGTGDKPTLLKPGAEKIALYYQTRIAYAIDRTELGDGHLEVQVRCDLLSRQSGATAAEGYGSCCTMESKYRWRKADRVCPSCGQPAIIKGRQEYGGGWLCFAKRGGCGTKYQDGDPAIEGQQTGRTENPDVWDSRNTVMKMAMKRALVSAVLSLGSLSELFTQDIEDIYDMPAAAAALTAPAAAPSKPVREKASITEVILDEVERTRQLFAEEYPEAPPEAFALNSHQVERHLLKHATGKTTEKMKGDQVRAALYDLATGPKRKAIWTELKQYLADALAVARKAQVAADFDGVTAGTTEPEDQGDPEIDYEREPGSDG